MPYHCHHEIIYIAHTLGYSLIQSAPNYFGKLMSSQLQSIFDGYSEFEKKQADDVKKSGAGAGRVEAGLHNMHMVPGVRSLKKKK